MVSGCLSKASKGRIVMQIYQVIVIDEDNTLYELDSPYLNENFKYDEVYDNVKQIGSV